MFSVNEDLSIYATRGDIVFFNVTAHDHGYPYKFKPGDIVRFSAVAKKDVGTVEIEKDFPVSEASETVFIFLEEKDTKIGEPINKHKDYWYEVVLNPDTMPQTLIGNDEDGPKLFRLFPEASEKVEEPIEEEKIPVVDCKLDMTSHRPVENQAVAIAIAQLVAAIEELKGSENVQTASEQVEGSVFNADGKIERLAILTIDAYGVAVKNGFKGTVDEWLASLRGEKGDIGEAFTYEDFTEEQLEALKGANGFSPIVQVFPKAEVIRYPDGTMVTKEIGYTIRITDSEGYQDIDILHGEKGEKGADGTMTFEDLTDEQRESLKGDPGEKGDPGDSGVYILSEGETLEDAPADADVVFDPFFDTEVIPGGGIDVEGAVPGQTIAVKTVDANGKPTEWEAVDFPEGGGAKAFYVTITGKDGVYTADKTVAEITEAYEAGKPVYCKLTASEDGYACIDTLIPFIGYIEGMLAFNGIMDNTSWMAFFVDGVAMVMMSALLRDGDLPLALPNPMPIIFDGAVSGVYSGSEQVVITIPTVPTVADILAALPTWNGGSY